MAAWGGRTREVDCTYPTLWVLGCGKPRDTAQEVEKYGLSAGHGQSCGGWGHQVLGLLGIHVPLGCHRRAENEMGAHSLGLAQGQGEK